jgi:ElaB/YqjD/DUF883 family membrane-anchored ribosome-binding protein
MDQLINQNLEERDQTRVALTHKLETLELRLRDSIDKVKETIKKSVDVPYQVKQRPWTTFGLSMLLGCAAGRLLATGKGAEFRRSDTAAKLTKTVEQGIDSVDQMVRKIGNVDYTNQLSVVKGATLGAMASLLSELARRAVPTFLAQVEKYSQSKTDRQPLKKEVTDQAQAVHS